ncbi:response regulator transcription factor [Solibaculum mannosilyticum]|uniref:Stage 0 sporulation protein A homolog n=1 Tax=Solibaculum mannosilyticum TaxID=2780922 RepID=A0A7I8CZX4_9FIRM|nr:response regulator transcription factor [Solibaculum mannosilyticum]BCI60058.1 DNA-binding response regulator [Solibaculum mannosilyticum]
MPKLMLVEDDPSIREELALLLRNNRYDVVIPPSFYQVADFVKQEKPDLILLDINLPGKDGFQMCTEIRGFSSVPIIFVTSRATDMDELSSITLGGDDFITKPYNSSILLARIAALLKRAYPDSFADHGLTYRGLDLNVAAGTVSYQGRSVELTKNELKILHYLFLHHGLIVSRADIIEYLWDNEMFVDDNTLSVNVTRIRRKLETIGMGDLISTKRGQGYMI